MARKKRILTGNVGVDELEAALDAAQQILSDVQEVLAEMQSRDSLVIPVPPAPSDACHRVEGPSDACGIEPRTRARRK